ncbi:hypothetical protein BU14_0340s0009 [Porphyra umbilicalis]|uniref:Uncharacterized protein n=1 Tax=Porphyra umbilicalis TaxID=2786 RepID=A0A1X6NYA5_PORUM|nr:hypothetical protein BU14_0340s0009 [Porphyra umbilicalis]|eukprot:OSX73525.1 hypothetical protein BU14_0340s0009 [Porphyra umbilicalis]
MTVTSGLHVARTADVSSLDPRRTPPPPPPPPSSSPSSNGMQRRRRASVSSAGDGLGDHDVEAAKPGSPRWARRLPLAARRHPVLAVAAAAAAVTALLVALSWWGLARRTPPLGTPASRFPGRATAPAAGGGRQAAPDDAGRAADAGAARGAPLDGFPDVLATRLLSPEAVARRHPPLPTAVAAADAAGDSARGAGRRRPPTKLVGLVEARNALRALPFFLSALASLVDSVVLLDDVSTDASAAFAAAHGAALGVEVLLTKTRGWVREELRDRSILLAAGRSVGGTHFVLLDTDEFVTRGCVADGTLRARIGALPPGAALPLPWIEAWRGLAVQRVRPDDAGMNFLTRRQVVVFADDGAVAYGLESSLSRTLSAGGDDGGGGGGGGGRGAATASRPATIHSLRCPRTLCPPPRRTTPPAPARRRVVPRRPVRGR